MSIQIGKLIDAVAKATVRPIAPIAILFDMASPVSWKSSSQVGATIVTGLAAALFVTGCETTGQGQGQAHAPQAVHTSTIPKPAVELQDGMLESLGLSPGAPVILQILIDRSTSAVKNRSRFLRSILNLLVQTNLPGGSRVEIVLFSDRTVRDNEFSVKAGGGGLAAARDRIAEIDKEIDRTPVNPAHTTSTGTDPCGALDDGNLYFSSLSDVDPNARHVICVWSDLIADPSKSANGTTVTYRQVDRYTWPRSAANVRLALFGVDPSREAIVLRQWSSQVHQLHVFTAEHTAIDPADIYFKSSGNL